MWVKGTTKFILKGKGKLNASEGTFEGKVLINNKTVTDVKNSIY